MEFEEHALASYKAGVPVLGTDTDFEAAIDVVLAPLRSESFADRTQIFSSGFLRFSEPGSHSAPPFHGDRTGSNPVWDATLRQSPLR
jgi:hypothetical protein